jgi:hypothetical protein
MPHQEIHRARLRRDLILDDAVIAVQRRCCGVAEHSAADGKGALLLDAQRGAGVLRGAIARVGAVGIASAE